MAAEKLDPVMVRFESSPSYASLSQADKIRPNFLLAQFRRRTSVMGSEPALRINVNHLGARRQSGEFHVFDHSYTQSRHQGLLLALENAQAIDLSHTKGYSILSHRSTHRTRRSRQSNRQSVRCRCPAKCTSRHFPKRRTPRDYVNRADLS
jgi:hypothetical protein